MDKDDSFWGLYLAEVAMLKKSVPADMQPYFEELSTEVKNGGCSIVYAGLELPPGAKWFDPCQGDEFWYLTPLSYICPQLCKCHEEFRPGCPNTCVSPMPGVGTTSFVRASQNMDL